ncbi:MAG: hypothetical protein Q7V04_12165 [Deltaproteobacteria bacterium]|nr:hypothetical protein [Deltaproteobacteria bacterium]
MINFTNYIKHFASLNRAPGAMGSNATKRKAPHKNAIMKNEL